MIKSLIITLLWIIVSVFVTAVCFGLVTMLFNMDGAIPFFLCIFVLIFVWPVYMLFSIEMMARKVWHIFEMEI